MIRMPVVYPKEPTWERNAAKKAPFSFSIINIYFESIIILILALKLLTCIE